MLQWSRNIQNSKYAFNKACHRHSSSVRIVLIKIWVGKDETVITLRGCDRVLSAIAPSK